MRLADLITNFREIAFDKLSDPHLFSDALLTVYANEAQVEAARRARLITDSLTTTAAYPTPDSTVTNTICLFETVTASSQYIDLDPRIIFIRRVKLGSKPLPLPKIRREDIDMAAPGWEDLEASDVSVYVSNYQKFKLFFHTKFPVDDSVRLTVVREPLYPMSLDGTGTDSSVGVDPEIEPRYHFKLIDWMLWRALNNRDVEEKYDPVGAKAHYDIFEAEFGPPTSARDDVWIQERHGYDDYEGVF